MSLTYAFAKTPMPQNGFTKTPFNHFSTNKSYVNIRRNVGRKKVVKRSAQITPFEIYEQSVKTVLEPVVSPIVMKLDTINETLMKILSILEEYRLASTEPEQK